METIFLFVISFINGLMFQSMIYITNMMYEDDVEDEIARGFSHGFFCGCI